MEEVRKDLKPYDDASMLCNFPLHAFRHSCNHSAGRTCFANTMYKKMALKATDLVVSSNFLFEIDVKVKDSSRIFAEGAYVKGCDSWLIYHEGNSLSSEFNIKNAMMLFSTLP